MGCAGTRPKKSFDDDEGVALAMPIGVDDALDAEGERSALATGAEPATVAGDVDDVGAFLQLAARTKKTTTLRIEITPREYMVKTIRPG
jgi:poly(3-hydroxybutyrate) depolymerase